MKRTLRLFSFLIVVLFASCEQQGMKPCLKADNDTLVKALKLENFSGVELSADVDVYVSQGKDQSVSISGSKIILDALKIDVSGGAISISSERCFSDKTPNPKVFITIPQITRLEVKGTGNIYSNTKLLCDIVEFKILGAGDIFVKTDAAKVITTLSGSGRISLSGSANNHFIKLPGSGQIYAFGLETNDTDVDFNGWGTVEVFVQKNLNAKIRGTGDVRLKGYPVVRSEISGEGKVVDTN